MEWPQASPLRIRFVEQEFEPLDPEVYRSVADALSTVKDAVLPGKLNDRLSIVIGQTFAGIVGGLTSRGVARVLNNSKQDSTAAKAAQTGVYFGLRALSWAALWGLGIPRAVAAPLAPLLASLVTAGVKVVNRLRGTSPGAAGAEAPEWGALRGEISGDVCKWVMYDVLVARLQPVVPPDDVSQAGLFFSVGVIASSWGLVVQEASTPNNVPLWANPALGPRGLFTKTLEGGILFLSFEESARVLSAVIPAEIGERHYWFKSTVDGLGQDINSIVSVAVVLPPPVP